MSSPRRLLLAAVCAVALGGCGQEDNPRLIPSQDADALRASVQAIGTAVDDGECEVAEQGVQDARRQVAELPRQVAKSLRANLRAWIDQIEQRIPEDCEPAEEETPTPAPTEAPEETPEPTPTETPEPTPDPTETPAPTPPPGDGGEEGGGNGNGTEGGGNGNQGGGNGNPDGGNGGANGNADGSNGTGGAQVTIP